MGPVVLDTGVVVALHRSDDAHHVSVVDRLDQLEKDGRRFAISTVTITELMSSPDAVQRQRTIELSDALGERGLIAVDRAIAERASELRRARRSLRTPDALIVATADLIDAEVLITTDRAVARTGRAEYVGVTRR